jgi:hydrogenase-4 component E
MELSHILNICSMAILISSFALVAGKRVMTYIRTFRLQSALLAVVAAVFTAYHLAEEGRLEGIAFILLLTSAQGVLYPLDAPKNLLEG